MDHILVVDDNHIQMTTRQMILTHAGFNVTGVSSPQEGLKLLEKASGGFSAIITDHMMPGMDGAAFVRKLREKHAAVPVLVLSGLPAVENDYAGLNVLVRMKPVPPPELIKLVTQMTEKAA